MAALAHTVADRETPRCDPRINFPLGSGYPSKTLVSLKFTPRSSPMLIGDFNFLQLKQIYK
jgi:hypothetical protein